MVCIAWLEIKMCWNYTATFNVSVVQHVIHLQKPGQMILKPCRNVLSVADCCAPMSFGLVSRCHAISLKPRLKPYGLVRSFFQLAHQELFSQLPRWHMPRAIAVRR